MRNAYTTDQLLTKWGPILAAGGKIADRGTRKALAQVLENTCQDFEKKGILLTESDTTTNRTKVSDVLGKSPIEKNANGKNKSTGYLKGTEGREGIEGLGDNRNMYLPNVIMPMVRRIFPSLIAHELVGVQALNGPIGYALAYRAKLGERGGVKNTFTDGLSGVVNEMAFNQVQAGYTGERYGDETTLSTGLSAWNGYLGEGDARSKAINAYFGRGVETQVGEYAKFDSEIPTVKFDFLQTMVEARTRKLGAGWSPELEEDMEAMHNFDVENEFVNMVTYEIGAEIDRQIITEMVKTAIVGDSVTSWDPAFADGLDQKGRLATLLTQVTMEANQIAIRTRRGNANFVITSPRVTALLEQLSMNKFVSLKNTTQDAPSVPDSGVGVLTKVGLINDGQQLLVRDTYAVGDYLLMGYKGKAPSDTGIAYCPYVPVQMSKILDPETFTSRIMARTRYGIMNSVWDAKNYYTFMNINLHGQSYSLTGGERRFVQPMTEIKNGTLFV